MKCMSVTAFALYMEFSIRHHVYIMCVESWWPCWTRCRMDEFKEFRATNHGRTCFDKQSNEEEENGIRAKKKSILVIDLVRPWARCEWHRIHWTHTQAAYIFIHLHNQRSFFFILYDFHRCENNIKKMCFRQKSISSLLWMLYFYSYCIYNTLLYCPTCTGCMWINVSVYTQNTLTTRSQTQTNYRSTLTSENRYALALCTIKTRSLYSML